jgi:hypothetical protein
MIEKHSISDKEVWLRIDPISVESEDSKVKPIEHFLASYYLQDPEQFYSTEILLLDDEEQVKLFKSPDAALDYVRRKLEAEI